LHSLAKYFTENANSVATWRRISEKLITFAEDKKIIFLSAWKQREKFLPVIY
jgi:hypothetical protein